MRQNVFVKEDRGDVVLWRFTCVPPGVNVVFTTRNGGLSQQPYDSLNLGFYVEDLPDHVKANRELLASLLGLDPVRITSPRQRHTAVVELIADESQAGTGAGSEESSFDPCDGLATSLKNVPVLLHFADCAPVVLTGQDRTGKPVIAVLHAGRSGLIAGVVENGVGLVSRSFDIAAEDLTAAIGPAIGSCCYLVDEDIAAEIESHYGPDVLSRDGQGPWLDMQSAAEAALLQAGIPRDRIHVLEICTSCDHDFYSYRRDGVTGRHGAIAWIE